LGDKNLGCCYINCNMGQSSSSIIVRYSNGSAHIGKYEIDLKFKILKICKLFYSILHIDIKKWNGSGKVFRWRLL
jgi:hypothetical protein